MITTSFSNGVEFLTEGVASIITEKEPLEMGDIVRPIVDLDDEEEQGVLVYLTEERGRVHRGILGVVLDQRGDKTRVQFRDFKREINFLVTMPRILLHKGRSFRD